MCHTTSVPWCGKPGGYKVWMTVEKSPFFREITIDESFLGTLRKWKVIEKVYKDVITLHLDADRVRNFASIQFIDLVHAMWSSLARYIQKRNFKHFIFSFEISKFVRERRTFGKSLWRRKSFSLLKKNINNLFHCYFLKISKI